MTKNQSIQEIALEFINKKNETTFKRLIKRLKPGLYSFTYKILKDRVLCEDAITETFISIWSKVDQYDKKYNFSTWAYAIAKNNCFGLLKEKRKTISINKVPFKSLHSKNFMYVNRIVNIETECLSPTGEELIQKLYDVSINAIFKLKEPYKTVMIEREINKKHLDDIADNLGWNLSTVKTRLRKAKSEIANIVKKENSILVENYLEPENYF